MQVRGGDQGSTPSLPPLRSNDSAFQEALLEALTTGLITSPDDQTGKDDKAWAGALSLRSNPYGTQETLNDTSTIEQPEPDESQGQGETFPAGGIMLPESSIRNKLEALLWGENEDRGDGLDTSNQINETVAAPSEGKVELSVAEYDSKTGTVTLIVNGRRFTVQFWGEGPPQLSAADIAVAGQSVEHKSLAIYLDGEGGGAIAPIVRWRRDAQSKPTPALWLGPGAAPPFEFETSEYCRKYYTVSESEAFKGAVVIKPGKLGENLRPKENASADKEETNLNHIFSIFGSLMSIGNRDPNDPSFFYSFVTNTVTMNVDGQEIKAYFAGYSEDPPTSARQIQVEGRPWEEGQSYILHEVSPQGRKFFGDYIIVLRDPGSTDISRFMPATVHPFDAAEPVRPDEIAILKTIFTEKIVDLARLRSGALSSKEVIAARLARELSDDEMAVLTRRHDTEFSQIYLTDHGGGGTHFLVQGDEGSVAQVLGANVRVKEHTHPSRFGAILGASPADYRLQQLHSELTPQRSEKIVPQSLPAFRYMNTYEGPFEADFDAKTVTLRLDGELVTVPVLLGPALLSMGQEGNKDMPYSAAEIQMPGDPWYGQPFQMYRENGSYVIRLSDYQNLNTETLKNFSRTDLILRNTLIVPLRDGQIVKARFSDDVVSAVLRGGDAPTLGNIRRPGAEDRGEIYRLYQARTTEWLIGFNNLNTPHVPDFSYDPEAGEVSVIVDGQWVTAQFRGEKPQHVGASDVAVPHQSWQRRSFAMFQEPDGGYGIAPIVSLTINDETVLALWMGGHPPPSTIDLQAESAHYSVHLATRDNPVFGLTNDAYVIMPG